MTRDWQLEKRISRRVARMAIGGLRPLLCIVAGLDMPPGCAGSCRGDRYTDEVPSFR